MSIQSSRSTTPRLNLHLAADVLHADASLAGLMETPKEYTTDLLGGLPSIWSARRPNLQLTCDDPHASHHRRPAATHKEYTTQPKPKLRRGLPSIWSAADQVFS